MGMGGPMLPFGSASAPLGGPLGGGMGVDPSQPFRATYRCYPVVMAAGKEALESGDKILLPASALDQLARRSVTYPMMFRLSLKRKAAGPGQPANAPAPHTHAGVMEFSADEGTCYLPYWMMQNLLLESGGLLEVQNVTLKKGSFVKFQPHSQRFTQLHNPRVVLERALRNFSCLTQGDTIAIQHGAETFYLDVKELKPDRAVSIIETDINVDFDQAKDAPKEQPRSAAASSSSSSSAGGALAAAGVTSPNAFSFHGASANHASTTASAAQRDFSQGGWGSAGAAEDEAKAATSASATPATATGNGSSSGSDYFARLGSGNKLTGKRGRGTSTAGSSAASSAQGSPALGPMSAAAAPASSSAAASAATAAAKPASALARPQSALAGRSGGYSLTGPSKPAAASSSSSSSASAAPAARPGSALGSSASSSSLGLGSAVGCTRVVERQGNFMYHYDVDAAGHKRLVRRLPAPAAAASTDAAKGAAAGSVTSSTTTGGIAAGKGYSLK